MYQLDARKFRRRSGGLFWQSDSRSWIRNEQREVVHDIAEGLEDGHDLKGQQEEAGIKTSWGYAGPFRRPISNPFAKADCPGEVGQADADYRAAENVGWEVIAEIDTREANKKERVEQGDDTGGTPDKKDARGQAKKNGGVIAGEGTPVDQAFTLPGVRVLKVNQWIGHGAGAEGEQMGQGAGNDHGTQTGQHACQQVAAIVGLILCWPEPGPPEQGHDQAAFQKIVVGQQAHKGVESPGTMDEGIEKVKNRRVEWIHSEWRLLGVPQHPL
jgi:hypothetical protein